MDVKQFERMKDKISDLQGQQQKAVAKKEAIEERWQKEYNLKDVEAVEAYIAELESDIATQEKQIDKRYKEASDAVTSYEESLEG